MTIDKKEVASVLAKKRSEKVLQKELATIKIEKHNSVADIKRCQKDMKKRLKRIRDRQREIQQRSKSALDKPEVIDNREETSSIPLQSARLPPRPKTGPPSSLRHKVSDFFKPKLEINIPDGEVDPSLVSDQTKSKIDLRPRTALALQSNGQLLKNIKAAGRLGTTSSECRYFDQDEINDRNNFYNSLVEARKNMEIQNFKSIEKRVNNFLGHTDANLDRRLTRSDFLRQTDVPMVRRKKSSMSTMETAHMSSSVIRPVSSGTGMRSIENVFKRVFVSTRVMSALGGHGRRDVNLQSRVRPMSHK